MSEPFEREQLFECPGCGGNGWYVGHEDECHETGDCVCSGVQVECEMCDGDGKVPARPLREVVTESEERRL